MANETMIDRRVKETLAIAMIGEGVVALLEPKRHMELWTGGPKLWRRAMRPFVDNPGMTRALAAVELGLGVWLASRQLRRSD